MVEINITLFVQMMHFLVMWKFLDRFFFQDVVKVIQREQAQLKRLDRAIETERTALHALQEAQQKAWQRFRKKFGKAAPQVEAVPDLSYSAVLCPVKTGIDKEHKQQLIKETKALVVKRVLDND